MIRPILVAVLIGILSVSVSAHDGAISLYTNETLSTCNASVVAGEFSVMILYVRGNGPEMGNAAEFKIEISSGLVVVQSVQWASYITLTLGDIYNGIAITGSGCIGSGLNVVRLGTINLLNLGDGSRSTIKVGNYPAGDPYPPAGIYITRCQAGYPMYECVGGTFVVNGTCNPATEPATWGAIKSLFK